MTNAVVTINGAKPVLPTVLGQAPARIPTGGKIRAGIKVLTKALADVNYDFTKITPAQVSSLENPNMVAASQHIVAYDQQVCGVKD